MFENECEMSARVIFRIWFERVSVTVRVNINVCACVSLCVCFRRHDMTSRAVDP